MGLSAVFFLSCLAVFGCLGSLLAQQRPLPPDHPAAPAVDRRQQASQLTAEVAGRASGKSAPVRRKNYIDDFVFSKMEKDGIPHAPLSTDEEFFRRVHIDLIGRIPDPEQLHQFLESKDADKRDKLVDAIVGSPAYRTKWTYWFGDLAMAAANRIGNEGKNIFYRWIYDNLQINRPWNEFVSDLITASAVSNWFVGPSGYVARWVVIGIKCEDTVHEDTSDELAIHTAKHFLGIDLNCISCHDGARHLEKINLWLAQRKREELWRMAAFFGKTRVLRRVEVATTQDEYSIDEQGPGYDAGARTVVRVPRRGQGMLDPVFLLTGEKADPTRPLRPQYASILTGQPQFARATVNRFWAEMMGIGIVDPPADFDLARQDPSNPPPAPWTLQPTHPELLEALAEDFRKNNHDVQRLLKLIAKSSAYQLSSRFPGEWRDSYARYYARKFVRRLTSEELYDSIVKATNLYTNVHVKGTDFNARFATETRSPEDFKYNNLKDIVFFLESFGQNNREYSERKNGGTITQAVLMMNSPWVLKQTRATPGSFLAKLVDSNASHEEKITQLFERLLMRKPAPEEMAMAKDLVRSDGRKGYEDLQWLLMNKLEFLFQY
ncbi:MAG: DUF1553 domain-containing protein [Acidobacteria bacterium]|nr:DUF1553 domain-containing protein [Acidobacteriota bacterium]